MKPSLDESGNFSKETFEDLKVALFVTRFDDPTAHTFRCAIDSSLRWL